MSPKKIAVAFSHALLENRATELAAQLRLALAPLDTTEYPLLLVVTEARIELRSTKPKAPGPIYVDFLSGALAHRRQFGGGRGQLIARAIGLKIHPSPSVLDLSAGLGRDAFVLATLGCKVTMIERNPIIAALLKDGLYRARRADWFSQLTLELIEDSAQHYLSHLTVQPEVIYFDPMYPTRTKSAQVKKEMRLLRHVVGADKDASEIVALALKRSPCRVVVKRPRHAVPIEGPTPTVIFYGKSSRFDVYCT